MISELCETCPIGMGCKFKRCVEITKCTTREDYEKRQKEKEQ